MEQLGLKFNDLELKSNFIDQVLLNNRNCIAHGERLNSQDITSAYDNIKRRNYRNVGSSQQNYKKRSL